MQKELIISRLATIENELKKRRESEKNITEYNKHKKHKKQLACDTLSVWRLGGSTPKKLTDINHYYPFMIEDYKERKGSAILILDRVALTFNGKDLGEINLGTPFHCGVMYCGRFFGAYSNTVMWSNADGFDNPYGFIIEGYLNLNGELGSALNMLVLDGRVVIVRGYGLTVLKLNGTPENITAEDMDIKCGAIYPDTASVVDGKLYFYSESGLKCFDGNKISGIEVNYEIESVWSAVSYKGTYFVGGRYKNLGKGIMCVRVADGDSCFISCDPEILFLYDGVNFFTMSEHMQLCEGGSFSFESEPIDFGTAGFKTVTEIKVAGKANISINNGRHTRFFSVKDGVVRPHMRGKRFTVTVEGEDTVKEVVLTAEVTDEN